MSIGIDHVLMLAGRLDDAPGFDTGRERYRRFLLDYVATPARLRTLVEECQNAPGEQHQRALHDLVVLAGRFLGFDVTFGAYPSAETERIEARWQSRARLHVVVDVRSNGGRAANVEVLLRSIAAVAETLSAKRAKVAGLCVLVSAAGRHRLDDAVAAARSDAPIGVLTVASLLAMAEAVTSGAMTHEQAVRVFDSNIPGDFVADLLDRSMAQAPSAGPRLVPPTSAVASERNDETVYWLTPIGPDHATRPEEFLEMVVGRRHVLGITDNAAEGATAAPGDWMCFYIAGKGIVGSARVASLDAPGIGLRDAHRFRQLLQIEDVRLHLATPVSLDAETELRVRSAGFSTGRHAPTLIRISRESFNAFAGFRAQTA